MSEFLTPAKKPPTHHDLRSSVVNKKETPHIDGFDESQIQSTETDKRPWLHVREDVYLQQNPEVNPLQFQTRYSERPALSEPFRIENKKGPSEWMDLTKAATEGGMEPNQFGTVIVFCHRTRFVVNPTPEQAALAQKRIVELSVHRWADDLVDFVIPPGQSFRARLTPYTRLLIRCPTPDTFYSAVIFSTP